MAGQLVRRGLSARPAGLTGPTGGEAMTLFTDRRDAGRRLGAELAARNFREPIVLGIPRGGVPVAAEVAAALDAPLGVITARKLRAPYQPELAIGAVTADGVRWVNERLVREVAAGGDYLERETAYQAEEAARRERAFDGSRRPPVQGRTVILVDDGIATGATVLAAARSLRAAKAGHVVVAVPVGPPETIAALQSEADEVVCLSVEPDLLAIGQFYIDFTQVEDAEVIRQLDEFRKRPVAGAHPD